MNNIGTREPSVHSSTYQQVGVAAKKLRTGGLVNFHLSAAVPCSPGVWWRAQLGVGDADGTVR